MERFINEVMNGIKEVMPTVNVSVRVVNKNNGVVLHGLEICKGEDKNIRPVIYLEKYYEDNCNGVEIGEIINRILGVFEESDVNGNVDFEFFHNYEDVKNRICFKVIGTEQNRAFLQNVPHRDCIDMAITYYYSIEREMFESASVCITNEMVDMWGITEEELYKDSMKNTPIIMEYELKTMNEVIKDILKNEGFEEYEMEAMLPDEPFMYVLSNKNHVYGAGVFLYENLLENIRERFNSDFYLLPSSVHECILVLCGTNVDTDYLKEMVMTVNTTEVSPEEVLTNNVYYYDGELRLV